MPIREQGAALLMTLLMLLMLGAGGSLAMHSALLQQRAATNLQLKRLSLLAAEQALIKAKRQLYAETDELAMLPMPHARVPDSLRSLEAGALWQWLQQQEHWQQLENGSLRMAWRVLPEGHALIAGDAAELFRLQAIGISGNSRSLLEVQHARVRQ